MKTNPADIRRKIRGGDPTNKPMTTGINGDIVTALPPLPDAPKPDDKGFGSVDGKDAGR